MTTVNKYRVWCVTDSAYEYVWGESAPTLCPANTQHTIDTSKTVVVEINNSQPTSSEGVPLFESTLRVGKLKTTTKTIVSIDFADKTTWYQNAVKATDEIVVGSSPWITYQLDHFPVIDIDSKRLTGEESSFMDKDGTLRKRSYWRIVVKVDGVAQVLNEDYTVNWTTGVITFASALNSGNEVKVTYYYVNPTFGSQFIVRPDASVYCHVVVEHAEIQFSKSIDFNGAELIVEIWAQGGPGYSIPSFEQAYFDAGYGQYQMYYRSPNDYINVSNEGKGSIPAHGSFSSDTLVFPFQYVSAISLEASMSTLFRLRLKDDVPYANCEIATGSFYCEFEEV